MEKPLWKFTDDKGSFVSSAANRISSLYLPLCNSHPFMSSISSNLHGDIKTNYNSFLLEPASRISLSNSKSSRNFWICLDRDKIWSATGVSKDIRLSRHDEFSMEAGILWQKITRKNKKIGIKANITSFVPATGEPVEIMYIEIVNISNKPLNFFGCAAIPVYGRSPNNIHDHRHVTALLSRLTQEKFGVIITPTLFFDETGHRENNTRYFVLGTEQNQYAPEYIYRTQEEFCGDAGDLEYPIALAEDLLPGKNYNPQGKETIGGLRFRKKTLSPGKSYSYIVIMGIAAERIDIPLLFRKFNTTAKIQKSLDSTKNYWQKESARISVKTADKNFDSWLHWVNIQPVLRKIFGCSFLPDFDYGKGGRGWRDLWQDCLYLILTAPEEVRPLLINNFKGVRIDGSNATIIGNKPGEFIADRNNISRVWMDHGMWPLLTTQLYIHQTGDLGILFEEIPYFRDYQLSRSREKDANWTPGYGKELKTKNGRVYRGSVLEHILIENIVQFFNVGAHNHIRLENADWNDGLDMAADSGESVAFTAMYARNLKNLCELLSKVKQQKIYVLKELLILLNIQNNSRVHYDNKNTKQRLLEKYFDAVKYSVSGKKIALSKKVLIDDLTKKADFINANIRKNEWLKTGFFNGYYDNRKQPVEGKFRNSIHMTLTGQAFPVLSGIADNNRIKTLFRNAKKYLKDPARTGFRLNTDFNENRYNLGRAFSFSYGEKENGAFFNHMCVMFSYALYARGFVKEGFEVINSIYRMCLDTANSKIYPGLPEYFNSEGRGMYSYLTGSATWFILTLLTQIFGIKGEYGDLIIYPKLAKAQFKTKNEISIKTIFAGKKIEAHFINKNKKDFGDYAISEVKLNGTFLTKNRCSSFLLPRAKFLKLANKKVNSIEITLS